MTEKTNSREVMTRQTTQTVRDLLDKSKTAFAQVLPKHMNADRLLRIALSAVTRTPKLMECDSRTLLLSIMNAALSGLEPNTPMGEGYLIPFRNNKTGRTECQFIPGYRGLLKIARNSGGVASIVARIVYENDKFNLELGTETKIEHVPVISGERGKIKLVYAIGRLKDPGSDPYVEVMTLDEIQKIRKRSKSADNGPWVTDFEQMAIKTVLRRICKFMPASPEMNMAVALDSRASMGETQIDLAPEPVLEALELDAPDEVPADGDGEAIDTGTGEITMKPGDPGNYVGYENDKKEPGALPLGDKKKGAGF